MTKPSAYSTIPPSSVPPPGVAQGRMLASSLKLIGPLGRGGMGRVWRAEHRELGSDVAVKFLDCGLSSPVEVLNRLRHEAQAAARIRSPYVVRVFDMGMSEHDVPYIVMELLEGETLGDHLEREGALSTRACALIVAQVAKALAGAHKLGIVHRDIKPENIFLLDPEEPDDDPFVKVFDFGIAKQTLAPASVQLGNVLGTPRYMSPEQLKSAHEVDCRADLWSLAVVAYEMLTGELPFHGESTMETLFAVTVGAYTPASALRDALPTTVDTWFEQALAKRLDDRFETAKDLATSFLQIMSTIPDTLEDRAWDRWMNSGRFVITKRRRTSTTEPSKVTEGITAPPAAKYGAKKGG